MPNRLFPNRRNTDFGKLLEQYIFCIADAFVEQADPETQQKLIRLFVDAGKESGPEPVNQVRRHDEK